MYDGCIRILRQETSETLVNLEDKKTILKHILSSLCSMLNGKFKGEYWILNLSLECLLQYISTLKLFNSCIINFPKLLFQGKNEGHSNLTYESHGLDSHLESLFHHECPLCLYVHCESVLNSFMWDRLWTFNQRIRRLNKQNNPLL